MKRQFFHRYPFSSYLVVAIFLVLMVAVAGLIGISYLTMEEALRDNQRTTQLQTENSLVTVFKSKEEGIRIFEVSLNSRLEYAFDPFLAEYELSGRDPSRMNLSKVKATLGNEMELYVIDEHATVVATTYKPELGLRFGDYAPYFVDYLESIRVSGGYHPDRIVSEKSTGSMKKFAYFATPDHRYVLELGLPVDNFPVSRFRYIDEDLIGQVEAANPYLTDVRVFESTLRQRVNDTSVEVDDPGLKALLAGLFSNRTTIEVPTQDPGKTVRYLFIDLKNESYGSDVSRILELTYTDAPVRNALASTIPFYFALGAIALAGCIAFAVFIVGRLTRPIEMMVDDVNTIAGGDLDHAVTMPIGKDLLELEEGISSMVHRLKQMIQELSSSEKDYRNLVESANSVIIRVAPDGRILFMNPFGLDFFGCTTGEILGRTVWDTILPPFDTTGQQTREKYEYFFDNPDRYRSVENENMTRDGGRVWMAWTNKAIYDDSGRPAEILGIGVDITRVKQIEEDVQRLNAELEQRVTDRTRQLEEANRNLESFTYSVSHDLRAPLRAISGYSTILLHDLPDLAKKDREYLDRIRQNAHEMGQLIDDLLSFSRLGQHALRKEEVFPGELVKEILQEIQADPGSRDVEFRIGPLVPCVADKVLFRQVFANLISNAMKFTMMQENPIIEIGSLQESGRTVYFVRDNGIGFDMKYQEKIFGVFQRLHNAREYEGTGVGLAIVHRIIEMHGGQIWVESRPDSGSTFFFTPGNGSPGGNPNQ